MLRERREKNKMSDGLSESTGVLKRKLDEGESQTANDIDLSLPPTKVRLTDDKARETVQTKPNTVDVSQSSSGPSNTASSQPIAEGSDDEREKMQ